MPSDEIAIRPMRQEDLDACMVLRDLAGWNQKREDWEIFLSFRPEGCFVAVAGHAVVGTVTTIDYDSRFSWIGMVIVHPECRRRGIGTALLRQAIDSLADCETIKLDATPAGKMVYDRLGFADEYGLMRLVGPQDRPEAPATALAGAVVPITGDVIPAVAEFDAPIFGADRRHVLETWFQRTPQYAHVLLEGTAVRGYCLGRPGANYETIGPVVAADEDAALALIQTALRSVGPQPVCIDTLDHSPSFNEAVERFGLSCQRPFIRMARGPNNHPGIPSRQWAVCGPEIG